MNNFLPDNYEVPNKNDGYMKFEKGENRFRVMGSPIIGWEWWVDEIGEDGKAKRTPIRRRMDGDFRGSAGHDMKHFWAMIVWNYQLEKFQILEITQKGIQKTIKGYAKDADWGSPTGYDLVITRSGDGLETEYEVMAKPAKPLDPELVEKYEELTINLEALYDGADPFAPVEVSGYEKAKAVAASLKQPAMAQATEAISEDEVELISEMFEDQSEETQIGT